MSQGEHFSMERPAMNIAKTKQESGYFMAIIAQLFLSDSADLNRILGELEDKEEYEFCSGFKEAMESVQMLIISITSEAFEAEGLGEDDDVTQLSEATLMSMHQTIRLNLVRALIEGML